MIDGGRLVAKCIAKVCRILADRDGRFSVILIVPDVAEQKTHCASAGLTFEQFNRMWDMQTEFFKAHPDAVMEMCKDVGKVRP